MPQSYSICLHPHYTDVVLCFVDYFFFTLLYTVGHQVRKFVPYIEGSRIKVALSLESHGPNQTISQVKCSASSHSTDNITVCVYVCVCGVGDVGGLTANPVVAPSVFLCSIVTKLRNWNISTHCAPHFRSSSVVRVSTNKSKRATKTVEGQQKHWLRRSWTGYILEALRKKTHFDCPNVNAAFDWNKSFISSSGARLRFTPGGTEVKLFFFSQKCQWRASVST